MYYTCTTYFYITYHVKLGGSNLNFFVSVNFTLIVDVFRDNFFKIDPNFTHIHVLVGTLGTEPPFIKKLPPKYKTLILHHIHYITFIWDRSEEEYESK